FQAEDGIRDRNVTGVQTCALPISDRRRNTAAWPRACRSAQLLGILVALPIGTLSAMRPYSVFDQIATTLAFIGFSLPTFFTGLRSEERRVGKGCLARAGADAVGRR